MRSVVTLLVLVAGAAGLWAAGSDATTVPARPAAAVSPTATANAVPAQNPDVLNYQGALSDAQGSPVKEGEYTITFRLYASAEGGSPIWTEAQSVQTRGGGFNCLLGSVSKLPVMTGDVYLELQVGTESPMLPRTRIAAVPFALQATHARSADTAQYALQGPSQGQGFGPGLGHPFGLGDSDWVRVSGDSVLYTIHQLGIARGVSNNVLYGTTTRQTHVNLGVACTTGTSNQNFGYCTIGGGQRNRADSAYATVCGGYGNRASGDSAFVGGGAHNLASRTYATVGGGYGDSAGGVAAAVGGGYSNKADSAYATVGGGQANLAHASYASVPGGYGDTCTGAFGLAAGYRTRLRASAKNTFAFGENCSTSTARAVVFYHSGGPTKLGVGVQNPVWNVDVAGKGKFTGKVQAAAGFKADTSVADSQWVTKRYVDVHSGGGDNAWTRVGTDSVLYTVHQLGIARGVSGNHLYGNFMQTHVNLGVSSSTGTSGQSKGYCAVGGGYSNTANGDAATVGGGDYNAAKGSCAAVGGGEFNTASGDVSTVAGGLIDSASGWAATVGGGYGNRARGDSSFVGGGSHNRANGKCATVGGGESDTTSSDCATVSGGFYNAATGRFATVGGGANNTTLGYLATVGGGGGNTASYEHATVGGGASNTASDECATVGGGACNTSGCFATVGGGYGNAASGEDATVGGGGYDTASSNFATVGGGKDNVAAGLCNTVGGGVGNRTSNNYATVAGGVNNTASYEYATVGGGASNVASGYRSTVAGGDWNYATGSGATVSGGVSNTASGYDATVGGGCGCTASADYSWAVGYGGFGLHHNSGAFGGTTTTADNQVRTQSLSAGTAVFTSDHPLDASGKLLNQYAMGSSELVMFYRGATTIGSDGRVQVQLPDYFNAYTRNPMVQLTGVGTYEVFVAENVSNNRFVIGGKPGAQVFWTVTGERKDVQAEIARSLTPVEQPKTGALRDVMVDDDALVGTMQALERMGKAGEFSFRTAAGKQRYEDMLKQLQEAKQHRNALPVPPRGEQKLPELPAQPQKLQR